MQNIAMNTENTKLNIRPIKFVLWLFIVASIMLFAAFTSSYIVRRAEGNWVEFEMPSMFMVSTVIIIASSLTMHWAYLRVRN